MSDLPKSLPWDTRVTYARLLTEYRSVQRDQMAARVGAYLAHIEAAAGENELLDLSAARALGNAMLELIKRCPDQHGPHLHAAVSYFVHADDAEHDLDSLVGFDDDVGVFNAVCEHVGLSELQVAR
jgi:hypothetical protein